MFFLCLNLGNLSSQGSSRATIVPNRESVLQPSTNSVSSVESIAQHFLANPEELAALQRRYPELAEALLSGDHNWMMSAMTQYRRIVAVRFLNIKHFFAEYCECTDTVYYPNRS